MGFLKPHTAPVLGERARTARVEARNAPRLNAEALKRKDIFLHGGNTDSAPRAVFQSGIVWPPRDTYHGSRFPETKRKWLLWSTALVVGGVLAAILAVGGVVALPIGAIGAGAAAAGIAGWILASFIF